MEQLKQAIAMIDPENELRFFMQQDAQTLKAYLTITNVSPSNIAYKVKTTSPKFYVVKPNQGIIDKGQKITIDITMIQSSENKIEDNKFLVQVALCELQSSETYQLQTYWDKLPKNVSLSYKLKVSVAQSTSGAPPPNFGLNKQPSQTEKSQIYNQEPQQHEMTANSFRASQPKEEQATYAQPQNLAQSQVLQGVVKHSQKHEYEKAPDDDINQSQNQSSISQSQVVVDRDQIKRKTDEVKSQLEQVLAQKQRLQIDIAEIKNKYLEEEKDPVANSNIRYNLESNSWQQPDSKSESKFQLIHLLITAIICLFIGGFLGARDHLGSQNMAAAVNETLH